MLGNLSLQFSVLGELAFGFSTWLRDLVLSMLSLQRGWSSSKLVPLGYRNS